MDWSQFGKDFSTGFDQSYNSGNRSGQSGTESAVAGIIPKILKRRRYKSQVDPTAPKASNPNDTGVPDYMSPQGSDSYDDKWGY